jgi:hypothetical protein
MGTRPCCRSCRHCHPPQGADLGWCQLRQLPIHPDLVAELYCHHWTTRAPRSPLSAGSGREAAAAGPEQLSLAALLPET